MKSAADKMIEKINEIQFKKPLFKIINNVTAEPIEEPGEIKKLLFQQIFSTVQWRKSLIKMSDEGIKTILKLVQVKY